MGEEHGFGKGALLTVGFPHGQSAYEPGPGVPLGYVGHGFKRFSRDRDRRGSAGICGACCPICCPSVIRFSRKGLSLPPQEIGTTAHPTRCGGATVRSHARSSLWEA